MRHRHAARRLVRAWGLRLFATLVSASGLIVAARSAEPAALSPTEPPYVVGPDFKGKKGDAAEDVSGIACLPSAENGVHRCLLVDDEARRAQFAVVRGRQVLPGETVELIGKRESDDTRGMPPSAAGCSNGDGKFKDLDGEAVAYAAPFFYVAGSHGCTRHTNLFRTSSFVLARFDVGPSAERFGNAAQTVATTWRLSDALQSKPTLKPFFAADLDPQHDGLNVEGIAVVGNRLFAGLRAPSQHGKAYLVGVPIDSLFASGHAPLAPDPEAAFRDAIALPLGEHVGIRDLSALPDGRLIVLAGPAQTQDIPYSVWSVDAVNPASLKKLAVLAPVMAAGRVGPAKAEAVVALGPDRILVLFDGLPNGGPREYVLPLR